MKTQKHLRLQHLPSPWLLVIVLLIVARTDVASGSFVSLTMNGGPQILVPSQVLTNRRRSNGKDGRPVASKDVEVGQSKSPPSQPFQSQPRFGNLPDVEWGSIPMDHLRLHPHFVALPLPEDLSPLERLEDVRNIRQDSWQWDALHQGRCTTSQAVAALGFLETTAANVLGIPSTWQRRGIGAYQRLQQPALRTLEEMNAALLPDNTPTGGKVDRGRESQRVWKEPMANNGTEFAAEYLAPLSNRQRKERRRRSSAHASSGMAIRMVWGNAQEATSVLTALNYFANQGARVREIGMCGAGLALNQTDGTSPSSLLIGATPDAVIEHLDGSVEALEVKNHCPFVLSRPARKKHVHHKRFAIRELPFQNEPHIFPHYVPQLQLEMHCLGPACRSAVMVRQTATSGARILRMHRDDEWIAEMLHWLQRFQRDFVDSGREPTADFFLDSPADAPRYKMFLDRTIALAHQKVDLVVQIPHASIQRSHSDEPVFLD